MSHTLVAPLSGGPQPRLEINNFVQNDYQFSLYVQALNAMQQVDQSQTPSFFQVGGIHGLPNIAYDGAVGANGFVANPKTQWAGYCTHGSTLFPTWHRPYVMLIEQIINQHAQTIAGTYTTSDKGQWVDAAASLRQPYWDWAANIIPPPEVIEYDTVAITVSDGSKKNVTNPLKQYAFHPIDPSFQSPFSSWPTTLRHPNSTDANAQSNITDLKDTLESSQDTITQSTYNMLTQINTWAPFADHTPGKGSANSLESIHDNIHVLVGGNGQMSDPSVAAFDPIFFLHHANVDRLLSMWSAIHPGVWLSAGDSEAGTFTLAALAPVDNTTSLTPFWKTQTTFWLSDEIQDFTSLSYTYPEFQGANMNDQNGLKNSISQQVAKLYGPNSTPTESRRRAIEGGVRSIGGSTALGYGGSRSRRQQHHHQLVQRASRLSNLYSGQYSNWDARVTFNRSEIAHSYSIVFFMNDVPEDPTTWLTCPSFIGAHHAFISGMQCTECDMKDSAEEGFVPLNSYIAQQTDLLSFASSLVSPLLGGLEWRVVSTTGEELTLESLEVTILETVLNLAEGAILPVVGSIVPWNNITQGRS